MTAPEKIKYEILLQAHEAGDLAAPPPTVGIDEAYDEFLESDVAQDYELPFREGKVETSIDVPYGPLSRYYEAKSVARPMSDGSWVGWTYWFGGGKHGNPEEIDWIDDAYDLDVYERQETVTVRDFYKREPEEPPIPWHHD